MPRKLISLFFEPDIRDYHGGPALGNWSFFAAVAKHYNHSPLPFLPCPIPSITSSSDTVTSAQTWSRHSRSWCRITPYRWRFGKFQPQHEPGPPLYVQPQILATATVIQLLHPASSAFLPICWLARRVGYPAGLIKKPVFVVLVNLFFSPWELSCPILMMAVLWST